MLDKVVPIEIPPERKRVRFHFPQCQKSGRMVLELKHVRKAYGAHRVFGDVSTAHRARRSHCAARAQRRRQIDADADAVRRGDAGRRHADRGPSASSCSTSRRTRRRGSTRRGPSTRCWLAARRCTWCRHPEHPRRLPLFRRRHLQAGAACCRAVSGPGWRSRGCCCARPTRCSSTSRPTTSIWTRRTSCSKRSRTSAARSSSCRTIATSSTGWRPRSSRSAMATRLVYPGHLRRVPLESEGARGAERPHRLRRKHRRERSGAPGRGSTDAKACPRCLTRASRGCSAGLVRRQEATRSGRPAASQRTEARQRRVQDLEARIAERELAIKALESKMAAPGFYDDRDAAKPIIDSHQALMWEVGDLMHQWEVLQTETKVTTGNSYRPSVTSALFALFNKIAFAPLASRGHLAPGARVPLTSSEVRAAPAPVWRP